MEKQKRERLLAAGWKVSTAAEFLDLSPEEESLVEARVGRLNRTEGSSSRERHALDPGRDAGKSGAERRT